MNKSKVKTWMDLARGTGLSGSVMDAIRMAYARKRDKATINAAALSDLIISFWQAGDTSRKPTAI